MEVCGDGASGSDTRDNAAFDSVFPSVFRLYAVMHCLRAFLDCVPLKKWSFLLRHYQGSLAVSDWADSWMATEKYCMSSADILERSGTMSLMHSSGLILTDYTSTSVQLECDEGCNGFFF